MNLSKHILAIVGLFICLSVSAQTFEEYKKNYYKGLQDFKEKREKRLQEMREEFDDYVKQRDQDFSNYLKKHWEEFDAFAGTKPPEMPKPDLPPVFKPKKDKAPDKDTTKPGPLKDKLPNLKRIDPILKLPTLPSSPPDNRKDFIPPLIQKSVPEDYAYLKSKFEFYSNIIDYEYDPLIADCKLEAVNNEGISKWWEKASQTNYNKMINRLLTVKDRYALNDWAYFLLCQKTAENIFNNDKQNTQLLLWFTLLRSGYDVKVGYYNNKLTVMFPAKQIVYRNSFLTIDGKKYYMMKNLNEPRIITYEKTYPGAGKIVDFNLYYPLNLSNNQKTRNLSITYQGKNYSFGLAYNPDLINLYNDYLVTAAEVYFDAAMSAQAKDALIKNLKPVTQNMSTVDAANFLLYFTQNAYQYQTDDEQFGKERFLFPEETICYPYSDCEDRSAFYAYLVRELLQIEIVGLRYPGHIATAIKLDKDEKGDYISYAGQNFIIADPTFINAPIGLSMPKFKNTKAEIIALNEFRNQIYTADKFWMEAHKAGAFRGGINQDRVFDQNGNCYLTGFFQEKADFDGFALNSTSGGRQCFVAKYAKNGKAQWAINLDGDGLSTGISIALSDGNAPIVMGTFSGDVNCGRTQIDSPDVSDIFLLKLSSNGDVDWLRNAGLEKDEDGLALKYAISFDSRGNHLKTDLFEENSAESSEGIFIAPDGDVLLAGAFNNTTGLNLPESSYADVEQLNYTELLKSETDKLIANDVEESISGLFAVINLVKSSGVSMPGKAAQQALDKYNPGFKSNCKNIYKSIGQINFLRNSDGVITIKLTDEKYITLDKIKLSNDAKVKISSKPNGNEQLDILSGVTVGKMVVWYNLNFVQLMRNTGDLLFDYDTDHTQLTVNLREDILD